MKDASGASDVFYVYPQNGKDKKGNAKFDQAKAIAVKYLLDDGRPVVDPNPDDSNRQTLYRKLRPNGTIDRTSRFQNEGNYLVVGSNFNLAAAAAEASKVNAAIDEGNKKSPIDGLLAAKAVMDRDFRLSGKEDQQRRDVPDGETDAIAQDAASWYFGYVVQETKIPVLMAEFGAGYLNFKEGKERFVKRLLHLDSSNYISLSHLGMDAADAVSFDAGVRAAKHDGFHKSILGFLPQNEFPFAPRWPRQKKSMPLSHGNRHAANNGFHSTVTGTMNNGAANDRMTLAVAPEKEAGSDLLKLTPDGPNEAVARTNQKTLINLAPDGRLTSRYRGLEASVPGDETQRLFQAGGASFGGGPDVFGVGKSSVVAWFATVGHARARGLPSFAPGGRRTGGGGRAGASKSAGGTSYDVASILNGYHAGAHADDQAGSRIKHGSAFATNSGPQQAGVQQFAGGNSGFDDRQLRRAVSDLLDQEARLPPSGMTGFDPRLSPAWPGLKLQA